MTRYIDTVLAAALEETLPPAPSRPIVVVGPTRPGALPRLLDGWGLDEDSVAWIGTPGGSVGDSGRAALVHAVAHAVTTYGCGEVWCLVESEDPAFDDKDVARRARLGVTTTPRGVATTVVRALVDHPALPAALSVVGVVASGATLRIVATGVTQETPETEVHRPTPTPSKKPTALSPAPLPPPMAPASSALPVRSPAVPISNAAITGPLANALGSTLSAQTSSLGSSGSLWSPPSSTSSMFGSSPDATATGTGGTGVLQGDSWGATDGDSWGATGGDSWGAVGGDSWGDVELPDSERSPASTAPTASAFPADPTPKRPPGRPDRAADLSGVAPAIVDAARILRRFVDEVPSGVLLRVIRSRLKTGGSVRAGLKDLCTLVKEYGDGRPKVMDAYRMVDHALPRVREKQAMKVLTAIFNVE